MVTGPRSVACLGLALVSSVPALAAEYFAIRVVDDQTGRGVPLVELATTNNIKLYTDSAGLIALDEPGLTGREVFFHVRSHGYEYPADGFGYRGVRLTPAPGGEAEIRIRRLNLAERLYRITGGGIYRDSVLLGRPVPLKEPVLNALVFGQDSIQSVVYRDQVYFFWGDTGWPAYPLGNFHMAGATAELPGRGGLSPDLGIDLTYWTNERGFAKEMAPTPGHGPTWLDGFVTLADEAGRERLYALFTKVKPDMSAIARGAMCFDDEAAQFKVIADWPLDAPLLPGGHPFKHSVDGRECVYYARVLPCIRGRADARALSDLSQYEAFTCLKEGSTAEKPILDRNGAGELRYAWKRGVPPLTPAEQERLIKSGELAPHEARFRLYDVDTGKPLQAHGSSVSWNEYRRRWVAIVLEIFGTSMLGELWYAEADTPLGPWRYARKIVTHDKYSFYNPRHHPFYDEDGGRRIYFEGTYTLFASGNSEPTPRYDYNQIMYRLDLGDPRVQLPVPVYRVADGPHERLCTAGRTALPEVPPEPAFFALERPGLETVLVLESRSRSGAWTYAVHPDGDPLPAGTAPAFYLLRGAAPETAPTAASTTAALCRWERSDGRVTYALEAARLPTDWRRSDPPLGRAWVDPGGLAGAHPAKSP